MLRRMVLTHVAFNVANFVALAVASRDDHLVANRVASPLPTLLRSRCNRAANRKNVLLGWRYWLVGARPNLCGCVWLAVVAGLLIGRSGCRAGQRGDAGASPVAFRPALARWRFRFQAVIKFFGFLGTHHSHVGDVRSA